MLSTIEFGSKSFNEIKDILSEIGLGLGMAIDLPPENIADRLRERKGGN